MQNIFKLFILLLAAIIISCGDDNPINDDNKISVKTGDAIVLGKITDDSGNPISGAEIDIEGNRTVTDSYGEFKIDNAAEGEVNLKISAENYFSLSKKIQTVKDKATYLPYKLASIDYEMTIKPEMVKTIKLNDLNIKLTINKIIAPGNYEIPEAQLRLTEFEKHTISLPEQYNTPEKFNGMFNPKAAMRIELTGNNGDELRIEGSISFSDLQEWRIAGKQGLDKDYSFYSVNEDINKIDDIHSFKLSSTTSIVLATEANEYSTLKIVDLQDNPIKNTPLSTNNYLGWTYVSNDDGILNNFFDSFHSPYWIAYIYHNKEVLNHVPYSNSNGAITFPINKNLEAKYTLEDVEFPEDNHYFDMFFLNDKEIFINTGHLYYSSNRGDHWELIQSDTEAGKLYFRDSNYGVTISGGIKITRDGGYNWESIEQSFGNGAKYFEIFDDGTGILISGDEKYVTNNWGENWSFEKNVTIPEGRVIQLKFITPDLGIVSLKPTFGHDITIFKVTTNGGESWEEPIDSKSSLNSTFIGDFINKNTGYLATSSDLYKTDDGGITWKVVSDIETYTSGADVDVSINNKPILTTWSYESIWNYRIENDSLILLDKVSFDDEVGIMVEPCWTYSLDAENKWYYTGAHLIRRRGAE